MKKTPVLLSCFLFTCALFSTEVPDSYVSWVFPGAVKLGMSSNEVFSLRKRISRDFPIGSLTKTNAITIMETEPDWAPLVGYYYYFFNGRLHAVAKTFAHRGLESEKHVCEKVHELVKRSLSKTTDETILRLAHIDMQPFPKTVELWADPRSGNNLYFDDDKESFRVIVFDPAVFSRKDFFADDETYRAQMVPLIEEMRKTVESQKKHEAEIKKLDGRRYDQ